MDQQKLLHTIEGVYIGPATLENNLTFCGEVEFYILSDSASLEKFTHILEDVYKRVQRNHNDEKTLK